jgi:hypothetical protein
VKRARQLGLLHDPRKLLAYYAVCKGLLTRYRRYGLSADSAVSGTNRKVARLLGRLAISAMKRKRREPFAPERQVTAGLH